jgi:nucleoside-diphosphate-sugar epimerase
MSTQVQFRRGTTAQTASFTGVTAEITVDTSKNTVVVHDGVTAGGYPLARESALTANVNSIFNTANAAFLQANTGIIYATSAGAYANAAFAAANTALTEPNALAFAIALG